MIQITTKQIDKEKIEAHVNITGSGKEIVNDFYSLIDAWKSDKRIGLLYYLALAIWESKHENN